MDVLRAISRHPVATLIATGVVVVLAIPAARSIRLDTDIVSLLPSGSEAADATRVFLERFGGLERVFVLVTAPEPGDPGMMADVLEDLTEALAATPEVATARCGVRPSDERFIERVAQRAPLLAGDDWRDRLETATSSRSVATLGRRLRAELLSPIGMVTDPIRRFDPLGLARGLPALRPGADLPVDPMSLTFQTDDASAGLVLVTPAAGELDAVAGRALADRLDRLRTELEARAPGWTMHALGGPLYAAHDERVLRSDLQVTATGSVLACLLVLVVAFGGWRTPTAILSGLGAGLVVAAAAVAAASPVTAVSVGLAAVLVGLGLDYGIHVVARFREDASGDLAAALAGPAAGIAASAATTAVGFAVLGFAHFRPLRETGGLVAVGILLLMITTFTTTGPVISLLNDRGTVTAGWRHLAKAVRGVASWSARSRRTVLTATAVLTVLAVIGLVRLEIDPDPQTLRPSDHPTRLAERRLAETFGVGADTAMVILHADRVDTVLEQADAVETVLRSHLGEGARILSPSHWLAPRPRTAARLDEMRHLDLDRVAPDAAESLRTAGLDPSTFEPGLAALADLAAGRDPAPPDRSQWPDWLEELIHVDADGAWAAVRVRMPATVWPDGPPGAVVAELERVAAGALVVSASRLGGDLRRLAASDLRRLAGIALGLMVVVVGVSFRGDLRSAVTALVPVLAGVTWTLGLWGLLGRPLGLLDLAALPILLGLGLDDGLHAVHGARGRTGGLDAAISRVGPPITLTTVTTCVGFASLGLSHVPALRSLGALVVVGVAACLAATLILLPALDKRIPT